MIDYPHIDGIAVKLYHKEMSDLSEKDEITTHTPIYHRIWLDNEYIIIPEKNLYWVKTNWEKGLI